jgi:hypothetical protein
MTVSAINRGETHPDMVGFTYNLQSAAGFLGLSAGLQ